MIDLYDVKKGKRVIPLTSITINKFYFIFCILISYRVSVLFSV